MTLLYWRLWQVKRSRRIYTSRCLLGTNSHHVSNDSVLYNSSEQAMSDLDTTLAGLTTASVQAGGCRYIYQVALIIRTVKNIYYYDRWALKGMQINYLRKASECIRAICQLVMLSKEWRLHTTIHVETWNS